MASQTMDKPIGTTSIQSIWSKNQLEAELHGFEFF